ncbi:MAG: DUF6522 family protein [Pseudomonadota bacterium]|nr:DUF6522 family protein [Pseudomonadota bacterium]
MGSPIPIELNPKLEIEIDATLVANGFGLAITEFQRLLEHGKITVLCERGTGADAGLFRASYYYKGQRVRLVVDASGIPVTGRCDA